VEILFLISLKRKKLERKTRPVKKVMYWKTVFLTGNAQKNPPEKADLGIRNEF